MGDGSPPIARSGWSLEMGPIPGTFSACRGALARAISFLHECVRAVPWLAAMPLALALAGCGGGPPSTFDLTSAHDFGGPVASRGALAIYEPAASMPLDSERIVIRVGPSSVAYLKGAQWADRLPSLVQARLIESFENSHAFRAVGRPGLVAPYSLQSEIRRFEADATLGKAYVEISVRIVAADGRNITSKVFSAEATTAKDDAATVTAGLDEALTNVLHQIVLWTGPKVARA